MKLTIPLLIVSTSALAATTIQYAQRAATERKRADDAVVVTQKQETRIREMQIARNDLDRRLQEIQSEQAAAPPPVAKNIPRAPQAKPAAAPAGPPTAMFGVMSNTGGQRVASVTRVAPGGFVGGSPMSQASPAAQRYMRLQTRQAIRKQYEDIGPALGLSQEQGNRVIDLLADQMTRNMTEPRKALTDTASMMKQAQEIKARNDAELAGLIGQDKVPLWEDYQKSLPQRSQVNMVRDQLETMGMPLTDDQRVQLLNVMMEERDSNPYPMRNEGLTPEEHFEQSMKWQDENDKRLLERLKGVLNSEQYAHYRDYQAYHAEMRSSFRMFRPAMPVAGSGEIVDSAGNGVLLRSYAESSSAK